MHSTRTASRRSTLARRAAEPGWVVLPLRAFLGGTFLYAGLQKLADKHFFDAKSSSSVQAQLHAYARTSPIGGVLSVAAHHAVIFGLLVAIGELAVGIGALAGLWTRAAAIGGAVLSASFLLSVSWHARPFYYGADIVFLVAWMPLAIVGSGGVLSLDAHLRERARTDLALPPVGPVSIEFAAVRRLCGAYDDGACQLRNQRPCAPEPCPVLLAGPGLRPTALATFNRRTFLERARAAVALAAGATVLGGLVAIVGRLVPSKTSETVTLSPVGGPDLSLGTTTTLAPSTPSTSAPPASPQATPRPTTTPTTKTTVPKTATTAGSPPGTPIGPASGVPAGGAAQFTDPATGNPAYVLRSTSGRFRAFSAVCTHAGCTVNFSQSSQTFVCPCHGAEFAGSTGAVLQGPARTPLPAIGIAEGPNGELYAV